MSFDDPFGALDGDISDVGDDPIFPNSEDNSGVGAFSGIPTNADGSYNIVSGVTAPGSVGSSNAFGGDFLSGLSSMVGNLSSGLFGTGVGAGSGQTGLLGNLANNLNPLATLAAQLGLGVQQPTQVTPTTTTNNTLIYLAIGAVILILILRK